MNVKRVWTIQYKSGDRCRLDTGRATTLRLIGPLRPCIVGDGALVANTVQMSTDGLPPLRNTEQQRSEYSRGEGGEDAEGWTLVVARPGPSSINLSLI